MPSLAESFAAKFQEELVAVADEFEEVEGFDKDLFLQTKIKKY